MNEFMKRINEDEAFAKQFQALENAEARRSFLREAGYDVKDAHAFMVYLRDNTDFMEKLAKLETMDEKLDCIAQAGFFFSKEELDAEQERIAEEEFEDVVGGGCGLYIEGHCGMTCEPEFWKEDPGCDGYFKCTWG